LKRLLDYDPLTGKKEIAHYDYQTDTLTIETQQDVQKALDYTKSLANDTTYTRKGMKEGWLHYAHLPDSVILELRVKHGLSIHNPDHTNAIFRKVNELYPHLKTTVMRHAPKG